MFMSKISMSQTCLYNISYQMLPDFYNSQSHSATVQHNTNFATVHMQSSDTRQLLGGLRVQILRQFTTTVGGTSCYLWFKQSQSNLLQGHRKRFCSYLGTEQQWLKDYWILKKPAPTDFENQLQRTGKKKNTNELT